MKRNVLFLVIALLVMTSLVTAAPAVLPKQQQNVVASSEIDNSVTGIVIDARGFGLQQSMSPGIRSSRGDVLNRNASYDSIWVTANGAVEYYENDQEVVLGKSRAGSNYLIVKAVKVVEFDRDVVVSDADAVAILNVPNINKLFEQGKVVFIR